MLSPALRDSMFPFSLQIFLLISHRTERTAIRVLFARHTVIAPVISSSMVFQRQGDEITRKVESVWFHIWSAINELVASLVRGREAQSQSGAALPAHHPESAASGFNKEHMKSGKDSSCIPAFPIQSKIGSKFFQHNIGRLLFLLRHFDFNVQIAQLAGRNGGG
jgi:hypothetical protein